MKLRPILRSPDNGDAGGAQGAGGSAAGNAGGAGGQGDAGSGAGGGASGDAGNQGSQGSQGGAGGAQGNQSSAGDGKAWRPDWRETFAKGDAQLLTRFQRYGSPEAVAEALVHAQNRISKGELKPSLGKDATPEQVAEWRAANGVPDAPEKYDLGVKISDSGKAIVDKYLPIAHAANMTTDQVRANLKFMSEINVAQQGERVEKDKGAENACQEALRGEWGADYKRNMTVITNLLDGNVKADVKEAFMNGRLADGTPIASSPAMLRMLLGLALIDNPAATVVSGTAGDPMKGVDQEIAEIEKTMRTDRKTYNKDEKMQARYRELIDAKEKLQGRAKA